LDTGHPDPAVLEDVPEAGKFRNFVLEAIGELPTASLFLRDEGLADGPEETREYGHVDGNGADGNREGRAERRPWKTERRWKR
jgi:hypothetical protein